MLRNTFVHLPGVGPVRERTLWTQGILDWDCFLAAAEERRLPRKLRESAAPVVRQSVEAAAGGDVRFFGGRLPARETWRLYPEFAGQVLFLDIETTGLSPYYDQVTTIGALGGGKLALFINGGQLGPVPGLRRPVPATGHVQRQPVRRAVSAVAFPHGKAGSGAHRPPVHAQFRSGTAAA